MNDISYRISDAVKKYITETGESPTILLLGIQDSLELKEFVNQTGILAYKNNAESKTRDWFAGMEIIYTSQLTELRVAR